MRPILLFALLTVLTTARAAAVEAFDVVLRGGRVIDPETGLDAVRDVGIQGDRIAAISADPLEGARVIGAQGLVVAPGFIDLHQHGHDSQSYALKALDGVSTALERETGVPDLERLEVATVAARRKGRVQVGADADIVVFDAAQIQDRSTFRAPQAPSEGVRYLLVAGKVVVDNGRVVDGVTPGRALLADGSPLLP